jgi:Electron transfer DM13
MARTRTLTRRPVTWVVLTAGAAAAAIVLALFQPWKLWVDQTVHEAPPAAAQPATAGSTVLAPGTFLSHEHTTTGTVRIIETSDRSRYLRLEDLDTSNGPLLKVWLSDAPVISGTAGWRVFDHSRHVDLGPLKGNKGSQNYPLPAGVDLTRYHSVTIWCARFHVSFGAAPLTT